MPIFSNINSLIISVSHVYMHTYKICVKIYTFSQSGREKACRKNNKRKISCIRTFVGKYETVAQMLLSKFKTWLLLPTPALPYVYYCEQIIKKKLKWHSLVGDKFEWCRAKNSLRRNPSKQSIHIRTCVSGCVV